MIKEFTTVDQYGQILSSGTCMDFDALLLSLNPGETAIEMVAPLDSDWYAGGQWFTKPEQPSPKHSWDWQYKSWIDQRSLDQAKQDKWDQIRLMAMYKDNLPITTMSYEFGCDEEYRSLYFRKMLIANENAADNLSFSFTCPLPNYTVVTLGSSQLKGLIRLIESRSDSIRAMARALRAQIMTSTSIAAVEAINWA